MHYGVPAASTHLPVAGSVPGWSEHLPLPERPKSSVAQLSGAMQ